MISPTITAISPTRRLLPFLPPSLSAPFFFSVFTQAALAHLEGIIDDPHGHLREDNDDDESKINGTPEGGQFSDGDEAR